MYERISVDDVARILDSRNLNVKREKFPSGEPFLTSATGGRPFHVRFYHGTGDKNHQDIQFVMGFDSIPGASIERMNIWNSKMRMARAFQQGTSTVLWFDIPISGGVTKEHLDYCLRIWQAITPEFAKFLSTWSL